MILIVNEDDSYVNLTLSEAKNKVALRLICKNKYKEEDLVHICVNKDFTAGWAFTTDSFCFLNISSSGIVKYEDIDGVTHSELYYLGAYFISKGTTYHLD